MKKAINKNVKRATALALSFTMVFGLALTSYAEGEDYNVYDEVDKAIIIDDNDVPEPEYEYAELYKELKFIKFDASATPDGVPAVKVLAVSDDKKIEKEIPVDLDAPGAIQRTETAMEEVANLIAPAADPEAEKKEAEGDEGDEGDGSDSTTVNKPIVIEVHQEALNEILALIGENGADKDLKQTETDLNGITTNLKSAETHEKTGDGFVLDAVLESNKEAQKAM